MIPLTSEIIRFFKNQSYAIIATVDADTTPHNSCKGIIDINADGQVYLLDLYLGKTYKNLQRNPRVGICAVDEHKFKGYCLKGKARILPFATLEAPILKAWEEMITRRLTQRVIKNISGQKGHPKHPEALLPRPKYMLMVEVEEVVNMTPAHILQGGQNVQDGGSI